MRIKERLDKTKDKLMSMKQRGLEVTEQRRAEKLRRKTNKLMNMKPGTKRTMVEGLAMRQSPMDVMKNEAARRKYEREKKFKNKDTD